MPTTQPDSIKPLGLSDNPLVVGVTVLCAVLGIIIGIGQLVVAIKQLPPGPDGNHPPGNLSSSPTPQTTPTPTPTPAPTLPPTPTPSPPTIQVSTPLLSDLPPPPPRKLLAPGRGYSGEFIRRDEVYKDYLFRVSADRTPVTITVSADYRSEPVVSILDLHHNVKAHVPARGRDPIIKFTFAPKFRGDYLIRVQDEDGRELRFDIRLD